jgi:hypothetical protein
MCSGATHSARKIGLLHARGVVEAFVLFVPFHPSWASWIISFYSYALRGVSACPEEASSYYFFNSPSIHHHHISSSL